MQDDAFRSWLAAQGQASSSIATRLSDARRVEAHYGDLDTAFAQDGLAAILAALAYTLADRAVGKPNPSRLPIDGDIYDSLASYRAAVTAYARFRGARADAPERQVDRIRRFVMDTIIRPARARGEREVIVVSGDVHKALRLENAMPAVCSALDGRTFQQEANVRLTDRQGPRNSSTVRYTFALATAAAGRNWAEAELRRRYDAPATDTDKMVGFHLKDGRAIALQRDVAGVQLWLEEDAGRSAPPVLTVRHYLADQPRHSNLPKRLKHVQPGGGSPRPVMLASVREPDELRRLLDWYEGAGLTLDRAMLEALRQRFVATFPDFATFEHSGGFGPVEDAYKRVVIAQARGLIAQHQGATDTALGGALLDLVGSKKHNLLGYFGTYDDLHQWRASSDEGFEGAAGALVRSAADSPAAIQSFVDAVWPAMAAGRTSKPYGESRIVATLLLALARPADAIFVRTTPFDHAGTMLLGRKVFGHNPLTAAEYATALGMTQAIFAVMRDEWGWQPRDLWDVQGFIWVTCQKPLDAAAAPEPHDITEARPAMPNPTNLILYGPPGTGKTYATAEHAVRLCGEEVPGDRTALMDTYKRLSEAGRIEFVTFHQSMAYEEFVEGLRPSSVDEDGRPLATGFQLRPMAGIFRKIAERAGALRARASGDGFDLGARQVFKMSLGEAANPDDDYLYDEAMAGGYVLLGDDSGVDWTAPGLETKAAMIDAFAACHPERPRLSPLSGYIEFAHTLRSRVKTGDVVIVSKGNLLFRAIGEVTGEFEATARENGDDYRWRRSVRWLWRDDDGKPYDLINAKRFSQRTIYELSRRELKANAIESLLATGSGDDTGTPQPFVLVIDEINRANISKVFGELITLLEADKRIGADNELRVRLPYSGDSFGVPANLHIVGTMNTADRSIALLDTALRRRFTFEELMPDPSVLAPVDDIDLPALLTTLNDRIEYLFDREHRIGHAYFLPCKTRDDVSDVMRHKVIPLLAEYFYEDWTKVAAVLGDVFPDDGKDHDGGFLSRRALRSPFAGGEGEDAYRYRWTVRDADDFSYAKAVAAA